MAVVNFDSKENKTTIPIKGKVKQIMNQLFWEKSPFEDGAAMCN